MDVEDKVVEKLHKHLVSLGLDCELLSYGTMDFEYDYPRISLDGPTEGIASRGSMRVKGEGFDFLDVLKKKTVSRSEFAPGAVYGMGIAEGVTWRTRFFLSFPENYKIGPLKIGTLTKILRGRFSSKVEDYIWSGYGKLTTLPPGMVYDDVIAALEADTELKEVMKKGLLKEKIISISVYSPKKSVVEEDLKQQVSDDAIWYKYKPKEVSNAKIVITSDWKGQRGLFLDKDTLECYQRISKILKAAVKRLEYHLTK